MALVGDTVSYDTEWDAVKKKWRAVNVRKELHGPCIQSGSLRMPSLIPSVSWQDMPGEDHHSWSHVASGGWHGASWMDGWSAASWHWPVADQPLHVHTPMNVTPEAIAANAIEDEYAGDRVMRERENRALEDIWPHEIVTPIHIGDACYAKAIQDSDDDLRRLVVANSISLDAMIQELEEQVIPDATQFNAEQDNVHSDQEIEDEKKISLEVPKEHEEVIPDAHSQDNDDIISQQWGEYLENKKMRTVDPSPELSKMTIGAMQSKADDVVVVMDFDEDHISRDISMEGVKCHESYALLKVPHHKIMEPAIIITTWKPPKDHRFFNDHIQSMKIRGWAEPVLPDPKEQAHLPKFNPHRQAKARPAAAHKAAPVMDRDEDHI